MKTKKPWYLVVITVILILIPIVSAISNFNQLPEGEKTFDIGSSSEIWNSNIGQLLSSELWATRDAYDSSHILMVPLHYVFVANDEDGIREFELLFAQFSRSELPFGQLNQVQWLYLVSRYLALKSEFGGHVKTP